MYHRAVRKTVNFVTGEEKRTYGCTAKKASLRLPWMKNPNKHFAREKNAILLAKVLLRTRIDKKNAVYYACKF